MPCRAPEKHRCSLPAGHGHFECKMSWRTWHVLVSLGTSLQLLPSALHLEQVSWAHIENHWEPLEPVSLITYKAYSSLFLIQLDVLWAALGMRTQRFQHAEAGGSTAWNLLRTVQIKLFQIITASNCCYPMLSSPVPKTNLDSSMICAIPFPRIEIRPIE